MSFDLNLIIQAAEQITQKIKTGEITEACCMSATSSPVTEAWDLAKQLADNTHLSTTQQQIILKNLNPVSRKQLESSGFDDFDLIYEQILQLVGA